MKATIVKIQLLERNAPGVLFWKQRLVVVIVSVCNI